MTRVKGFVIKDIIAPTVAELPYSGRPHVYVEHIPSDAVKCEAVVKLKYKEFPSDNIEGDVGEVKLKLHKSLIGKKISVIIIPMDDVPIIPEEEI